MLMVLVVGILALLLIFVIIPMSLYGIGHFIHEERRIAHALFKRMTVGYAVILGVALIIGIVFGVRLIIMIQGFKNQKQVVTVSDEAARQETWQPDFSSVGNLDPVQGADISNQVAGNVSSIGFDSGQEVQQGQLLVQLDDSNERAQLQGYQAQLELAQLNDKRSHDLFSKKLISQSDADTADANLKQAQANVANTQADIAKKTIRAPFSGHAGIRNVNLGQYLPAGTVIVTLQDLGHMYASFTLPEQALPSLAPHQGVVLGVDAYPNQKFNGEINAIDSKVDPSSHTVRVQGLIANPQHLLRAGMFANVTVSSGKPQQVVTVPKAAVTYSLYGDSVFVVTPDKDKKDDKGDPALTVNEVFVKLGDERGARVAITEGVKPGDLIVTSGMQKLHTGAVVEINNSVTPDQTPGAPGK
ncbi:MAG: efflux RND transporter periplasmic adaptor subunit [Bacillota bacterium]